MSPRGTTQNSVRRPHEKNAPEHLARVSSHAGVFCSWRESVVLSGMDESRGRQERERERLRKLEAKRKEQRWLNPTEAQLQREYEFMDWQATRPDQHGDEPPNDTYELFLAERRRAKEKERLRLVAERRKAERQQQRRQAEAARPVPARAAPKRRGRPVDSLSKRQRELAERKQMAEEDRVINEMAPAALEVWKRKQYERELACEVARLSRELRTQREEHCVGLLPVVPAG